MKSSTVDLPAKVVASSARRTATPVQTPRSSNTSIAPQPAAATQEEIADLAYQLWERDGCQHGNDLHYWHTAEQQLRYRR